MREPMQKGDVRPGILILARKDYRFAIPPGYHPLHLTWTQKCESSSLIRVGDYKIPENGRIEFRDKSAEGPGCWSTKKFEVLTGAGDGIYPVEIIKDIKGVVSCVKVRFDGKGDVPPKNPSQGPLNYDFIIHSPMSPRNIFKCEPAIQNKEDGEAEKSRKSVSDKKQDTWHQIINF